MTPPENSGSGADTHRPEAASTDEQDVAAESNGSASEASESAASSAASTASSMSSPPWQRVARELESEPGGRTDYLPRYEAPGGSGWGESTDRMAHTGDLPVVTGVAAQGLFGNPPPGATGEQTLGLGREGAGAASMGTRGRAAPSALRRPGRGPRRASLMVKRIDPWSVLKLSLVLGVALFLVWMVAVGLLYIVLDGMGVWDKLNGTYTSLVSGEGADAVSDPLISAGRVFGVAAIIGMVNIVLLSALATVSAFIYNVSADLAGGLEITLSERE